jgi:hypothetical protein
MHESAIWKQHLKKVQLRCTWGSATAKNGHRQWLNIALLLPEFGNGNPCNGLRDCLVIADPLLIAIAIAVVIAIA